MFVCELTTNRVFNLDNVERIYYESNELRLEFIFKEDYSYLYFDSIDALDKAYREILMGLIDERKVIAI